MMALVKVIEDLEKEDGIVTISSIVDRMYAKYHECSEDTIELIDKAIEDKVLKLVIMK